MAKPEDVASPSSVVAAYYDLLSGPASSPRDWNRFRSLFHPDARFVNLNHRQENHTVAAYTDLETLVARLTRNLAMADAYEMSTGDKVETFQNMVSVWSSYETRRHATDSKPILHGVNNFQMENDGERFWIVGIVTESSN